MKLQVDAETAIRVAFGFALKDLAYDMDEPDILLLAEEVQLGRAIKGSFRAVQDRFARVCQDLRLAPDQYHPMRDVFFSSWLDWKEPCPTES